MSLKPPRSFAAISRALDMASDILALRALDGAWRQRPKGWLSGGARNAAESESDDNRCEIRYHTSAAGCYIHTQGVLSGLRWAGAGILVCQLTLALKNATSRKTPY